MTADHGHVNTRKGYLRYPFRTRAIVASTWPRARTQTQHTKIHLPTFTLGYGTSYIRTMQGYYSYAPRAGTHDSGQTDLFLFAPRHLEDTGELSTFTYLRDTAYILGPRDEMTDC